MKIKAIIFFLIVTVSVSAQVKVQGLRCEMLQNPLGIDVLHPRFSWQLQSNEKDVKQISYQIFISSTEQKLKMDEGDIWNSGVVKDNSSLFIDYEGSKLKSAKKYYWKVKVVSNKTTSISDETAFFSTGLLQHSDWKASWIGYDKASPWDSISQWSRLSARYFRKEFSATSVVKRATVYISGLGLYELYINGNKIGDQVLAPNPTDYRKSFFYNTFDVTSDIQKGDNAIATVLGNGRFFTMRQDYKPKKINNFGFPKMLLQLEIEYADGSKKIIVSDKSWKLNVDGPIRTNNEYDGEEYDATKEFSGWTKAGFNDNKWMQPQLVKAPAGEITAQMSPPMKVMKIINPISIKNIGEGKYILDMGQNFAGWLRLKNINGSRGQKITLRFAESLQKSGELYTANLRDAKSTDTYILKGVANESWAPAFVYHGFRYVEIAGFPGEATVNNFVGELVYDDLETIGSFETSNETINTIYKNAWWGIASDYKGMPVDCPQRNERQPWLGDRAVGEQGESFMFGNAALYAKWMDDIEQSQTAAGSIPDVAPAFWNYYSDNITWPATYITVTNNLYNQYGDIKPIQKHYASMRKWILYMKDKYLVNDLMTKDKYGDWCVPPENLELIHAKDTNRLTDGKLIATAYYYKLLSYMQRFAKLSNHVTDIKEYENLREKISVAFQKSFYDPQKKCYSNNTVTANLLPLYFGICPDSLKEIITDKIIRKISVDNNDHISTGVIGTQYLMRGLSEFGNANLAYTLATNTTYPGWGYMVANGATTIWELWNGNTAAPNMNSQNHVMLLGDLVTWFYENLAGIRTDKTDVGFKKIILKPNLPNGLQFVNASYKSYYGLIKSNWKKSEGEFEWNISIPANTTAVVYLPSASINDISVSSKKITEAAGVQLVKWANGIAQLNIASGDYQFNSTLK